MNERHGLSVLEFAGAGSGIAAAYAGWLFRRIGADVTRIGAELAEHPPVADSPLQLACEVLAAGKPVAAFPQNRAAADALLADVDILLYDARESIEPLLGPCDEGFLRKLSVSIRRPNIFGDVSWCRARITNKRIDENARLVDLKLQVDNQLGETTATGTAVIELPHTRVNR